MSDDAPTPLHAITGVICDALCNLPAADQRRALEIVAMTLGLPPVPPPAATPAVADLSGGGSSIDALLADLFSSLRTEQVQGLRDLLDPQQLLMVNVMANQVLSDPVPAPNPGFSEMQGTAAT